MSLDIAKATAVPGIVGGAFSTGFFHTPALSNTALKIIALGAVQGAVTQIISFQITVYFNQEPSFRALITQLASGAVISAAVMVIMGSTRKEALANFALSSMITWIVLYPKQQE